MDLDFLSIIIIFLTVHNTVQSSTNYAREKSNGADKSTGVLIDSKEKTYRRGRSINRSWQNVHENFIHFSKAAYFSGKNEILWKGQREDQKLQSDGAVSPGVLPREEFTVEVWVKPEGGQFHTTTILGKRAFLCRS